jgi:dihydrolipoamide dehydrogenase
MEKYDLCIIGGGSAGYAAAMRAIDFNKKVLLVEKNKIGGAGVYNGALSSKTLWEFSNKIATINNELKPRGLSYDFNFADVQKVLRDAIEEKSIQLTSHLELLEQSTKNRLFYHIKGAGKLLSKHEVELEIDGTKRVVYAENVIIATGSRPRILPNITVDEKTILTSDGIEQITDFPKSLVVLGAGVIGCEYATIFSNFGKTKVYIIDKADRILPFEDADLGDVVAKNFEKNGIVIHRNASLVRMEIINGEVEYELAYTDGKREVLRVEKALLSVGRVPNVENLGLEEVGVAKNDKGYVFTNDTQTNISNIYAVGDVAARISLVNVGEREGRHAVAHMNGLIIKPLEYRNISTIMFLNPEVAAVGLNEQECAEKHIPIRVAKVQYACITRAIAMRKTDGFFKLIVTDDKEMQVLGMRAVGEHASTAIQGVALLIHMNLGIKELGNMVHPHPSIIEGVQECARLLLGKPYYKSSLFKDMLKCYSCVDGVCTPLENL